jgi:predicted  nucleic acid-binding Zn-ribbon protein
LEGIMKALIGLQDCDTRIRDINRKKAEAPIRIQQLEAEMAAFENRVEEELKTLDDCRRQRRQTEQDIDALETQIAKSNMKLNHIKSNKEYRAGLKEINEVTKQKSLLEDKAIELMEEIEVREKQGAERKRERKQLQETFERDREAIRQHVNALDRDLERLGKERDRFSQDIDGDLLKRYVMLMEHKGGLAVGPVIGGVCQMCHIGIPPQAFNELIRGDQLMSCPHCARIIYWGEDKRYLGGENH